MPITSAEVFSLKGRLPGLAFLGGLLFAAAIVWIAWGSYLENPAGVAIAPAIKGSVPGPTKVSIYSLILIFVGGSSLIASGLTFLVSVFVAWFLSSWSDTKGIQRIAWIVLGISRVSFFAFLGATVVLLLAILGAYVVKP